MRVLDIQKSFRQLGEIRMGEKGDRGAPKRLKQFRLTSPDKALIEEAAQAYGGVVEAWESPSGPEWQVKTEAKELRVVVAPRELMQAYEEWGGGGLKCRCDGVTASVSKTGGVMVDEPCRCDPDKRTCKLTTRFSVMLPDLSGLGIWKVESHGIYAAMELPDMVDALVRAHQAGRQIVVILGIEEREVKKQGQPTKQFIVPYLKPCAGVTFGQMMNLPGYEPIALEAAPIVLEAAPVAALPDGKALVSRLAAIGLDYSIVTAWGKDGITKTDIICLLDQELDAAEMAQAVSEIIRERQNERGQS